MEGEYFACTQMMRGPKKAAISLTDALIADVFSDAPLEEAAATVAAVNAVMLAVALVTAHFAQGWHR